MTELGAGGDYGQSEYLLSDVLFILYKSVIMPKKKKPPESGRISYEVFNHETINMIISDGKMKR